ncbi:C-X-C motif chemokine 13 [Triplophysa rosa]|uniref:C-X-C motif chemokine 13 n=1 Tax=Triplophysa rosa TaxID=992332 RepID=A0A9W7X2G9_TRIRA|nr:C-X-C motif chemokine 13 [Triplophysa rosa]KAI7812721.1 putative C-X-C motif chemokine 13 [Triplophysa rosa]
MTLRTHLLLAATAVCCFTALLAFPMDGFATNNKCRCITTTTSIIPPRLFKRIEILPQGAHCRQTEIVITKKNNQIVCVDPDAKWINNVLSKVMKSKRAVKESIEPTVA